MPKLKKAGTEINLNSRLAKIAENGIYVDSTLDKSQRFVPGTMVVLSLGVKSENELVKALEGKCEKVYAVCDAVKGGYIIDATLPAFELARSLK